MAKRYRVGITRDILDARGESAFGQAPLAILDAGPEIEWEYLPEGRARAHRGSRRALRRAVRQHGTHAWPLWSRDTIADCAW